MNSDQACHLLSAKPPSFTYFRRSGTDVQPFRTVSVSSARLGLSLDLKNSRHDQLQQVLRAQGGRLGAQDILEVGVDVASRILPPNRDGNGHRCLSACGRALGRRGHVPGHISFLRSAGRGEFGSRKRLGCCISLAERSFSSQFTQIFPRPEWAGSKTETGALLLLLSRTIVPH